MRNGAPIRFLVLILGGWTLLRVAMLAPDLWDGEVTAAALPSPLSARPIAQAPRQPTAATPLAPIRPVAMAPPDGRPPFSRPSATGAPFLAPAPAAATAPTRSPPGLSVGGPSAGPAMPAQPPPDGWPPAPARSPARRWSGSAWLLARGDGAPTLAPAGTLGGSQAGARLLYRLGGDGAWPFALSARAYAPLRRTRGAEAALGLDWRPSAAVPVHLLVERRQRLGREGRSAFSITAYGGGSAELGRGFRLDGYAQAGIVGMRTRDLFVDGSARISRPFGPIEAGAAMWGAAQTGTARLDIGPQASLPVRARGVSLRLSAEYRLRIAGDARPASGPALSLGVDF